MTPGSAQNRAERVGEQPVAVVKKVALAIEKAVDVVEEVARDLLDPCTVSWADHAGDVDAARFEVDHEQHDVADEAGEREDLDGEEVEDLDGGAPRPRLLGDQR